MRALEAAMRGLVLGPSDVASDGLSLDAWLARSAASEAEAEALRSEIARLSVYRELVQARLRGVVELAMPRFCARLGVLFDEYFARYLAERGPRSRYLRDVTTELLEFMEIHARNDGRVPPWALDLARHEALDIVVGSLAGAPDHATLADLDADRGLVFSATARVVRYAFAVHRLSADPADRSEPDRQPTALFVYRSPAHDVRYLELTPLAAAILEHLLAGETLRSAVERGTRELALSLDAGVLDGTSRVLAELAERGAVTGAAEVAKREGAGGK